METRVLTDCTHVKMQEKRLLLVAGHNIFSLKNPIRLNIECRNGRSRKVKRIAGRGFLVIPQSSDGATKTYFSEL